MNAAALLPPSLATPAALSPAQLKAQLWADEQCRVYAVVMAARVPDWMQRLAQAELDDHDCLWPGALPAGQQALAPWLLQLQRDAAFTDWLLFAAAAELGDWGVIVLSRSDRLGLRTHLRSLLRARLPDGGEIALEWMDPEVLQVLLPLFDAAGLARFMGPMQGLVVASAATWTAVDYAVGRLQWRQLTVKAEART